MFYCDPCRVRLEWPKAMVMSMGKCEMCSRKGMRCHDIPSKDLPRKQINIPPRQITVGELIKELSKHQPEKKVKVEGCDCHGMAGSVCLLDDEILITRID